MMVWLRCSEFWRTHREAQTHFSSEQPRIKLIDLNWILALSQMYFIDPSRYSGRFCAALPVYQSQQPTKGSIFSSSGTRRKPIDSPISGVFRVYIDLIEHFALYGLFKCSSHGEQRLPPAAPVRITQVNIWSVKRINRHSLINVFWRDIPSSSVH